MIGKKLTDLLALLEESEFKRFRKLLRSPVYTANPHYLKLYDAIRKYYPDFDSLHLDKKRIFKKIYGRQTYDDLKLRMLASKFTRLIEDYLLLLEQENDAFSRKKQLVSIYNRRNSFSFFEKGTKQLLAQLEAAPLRDKTYYWQKAQLNEAWYFHPLKNKYDLSDQSFEAGLQNLDQYIVYAKIQYAIAAKSLEKILATSYDLRFMEFLEQEQDFIQQSPLLQLFWWAYQLLEKPETVNFEVYEQLLFQHLPQLQVDDQKLLFYNGLNYSIRQANKGLKKFNGIILQWYKNGLAYQLIMHQGIMTPIHFCNIINYAGLIKEYDWAMQFMIDHQKYLPPTQRKNIVIFNRARWYYFQKDFKQALSLLVSTNIPLTFELPFRNLMIRTIFELFLTNHSYYNLLIAKILAFENYLRSNHKFATQKKVLYLNHLKIVRKLAKKFINKKELDHVQQWLILEMESSPNIIGKQWLIQKMKDLKQLFRRQL